MSQFLCLLLAAGCSGGSDLSEWVFDGSSDGGVRDGHDGRDGTDAGDDADGSVPDATPDAPIDAGPTSTDAGGDPSLLSMQGVYGDFAQKLIPSDAITYAPRWELWSDGATKRRWILLPPGGQIDNTNQEHWRFPVGTRLIKEFTRNGQLVETRIIEVRASGLSLRTYVWTAAQTEAVLDTDGASNVAGTTHDVPTEEECTKCHRGEPGGALGISAVQLSSQTLAIWSSAGRFVVPIATGAEFGPSGTATQVAALGYVHANCGHCHNPGGYAASANNMTLRLDATTEPATSEPGYLTTVGISVQGNGAGASKRIDPGNPNNSAIVRRMSSRGNYDQMPPVGTELVHSAGVSTVTSWVTTIAP